jgi:hypothetical protein
VASLLTGLEVLALFRHFSSLSVAASLVAIVY